MASRHYSDAMRERDVAYWEHGERSGMNLVPLEEWLQRMEVQAAERYAADLERALGVIDASPPPVSDEAFAMAERWAEKHLPPLGEKEARAPRLLRRLARVRPTRLRGDT